MGILHYLRRARAGGWLLFAVVALLAIVQSASAEKLQNIENEVWGSPLQCPYTTPAQDNKVNSYTNLP
jgi:hypothetical protein